MNRPLIWALALLVLLEAGAGFAQGTRGRMQPRASRDDYPTWSLPEPFKHDVFTFDAPEWHVEGGAHWDRDDDKGVLRLHGGSSAYGGLDLTPLAAELRDIPDLRDVKIVVEGRA